MTGLDPFTWAIILLLLGCALVVLEVFIPSGGILGMLAGISILGSIFFAFRRDTTAGLSFVLVSMVAVPVLLTLAFRIWPHTPMGKAFLGELPSEDELKPVDARRALVGRLGVAKSKMLPSGSVVVDDHWIDAVTQGDAIEPGEPVVVVEVRANRVVVRKADPDEAEQLAIDPRDVLSKPINELGFDDFDGPLS
jgi:membrane-bound serine protease (ClpP class)